MCNCMSSHGTAARESEGYCETYLRELPSLASKREHVPPKHDLIGYKHGMFGRQTFEV